MSKKTAQSTLGGYFELELPKNNYHFQHGALLYQSARAAFRALLQVQRPEKVWVPTYICDAMLSPLIAEGIEYVWYDLTNTFDVPDSIYLNENDLLLYVNYFGVCQIQIDNVLDRFPHEQVILDFSQAFFDVPKQQVLATIYSPRKFFGVPDGGILVTNSEDVSPIYEDTGSMERMTHLVKRLYEAPESGYPDYLQAEQSLQDTTPQTMSGLTKRLLQSVEYQRIQKQRIENFSYLHSRLAQMNAFELDESRLEAPMCYPFMTHIKGLRDYLIQNRVFVPTYWRDASERVSRFLHERVIEGLLPLPLDQRYGRNDLQKVVSLILDDR